MPGFTIRSMNKKTERTRPRKSQNNVSQKKEFQDVSDNRIINRKVSFVRNAFERYYRLQNVIVLFDLESAISSTEVGILHYFFEKIIIEKHGASRNSVIVDAMAGGGTFSFCGLMHFDTGRFICIEKEKSRADMLYNNMTLVSKLKEKQNVETVLSDPEVDIVNINGEKEESSCPENYMGNLSVLNTTYQDFFENSPQNDQGDIIFFSPSWQDNSPPTLNNILDDLHGILTMKTSRCKIVVIKISTQDVIYPEKMHFVAQYERHKMVFYDRHAFDMLLLRAPWGDGTKNTDAGINGSPREPRDHSIVHHVRGYTEYTPTFKKV